MALGLLPGAVARTTEGAVDMATSWCCRWPFLSGSLFSLDGAPYRLQVVSLALPLRHLNDRMPEVLVRGEGPAAVLGPMGILLLSAAVLTGVAVKVFRGTGFDSLAFAHDCA